MLTLSGEVVEGMQAGQRFLSKPSYQNRIKKEIGFVPFPGTLNLHVNEKEWLLLKTKLHKISVPTFTENNQSFGGFDLYRIQLPNKSAGAIIIPLRTSHPAYIIEIIAPFSLREKFGLKNASVFNIQLSVEK